MENLKKLQLSFLKLADPKQEYILGVAEGLKYVQGKYGNCIGASLSVDSQVRISGRGGKWEDEKPNSHNLLCEEKEALKHAIENDPNKDIEFLLTSDRR